MLSETDQNISLALELTEIGLSLFACQGDVPIECIAHVALDDPDFSRKISTFREKAEHHIGKGFATDIWLPDEQIMFRSLKLDDRDSKTRREAAYSALSASTPFQGEALCFDLGDINGAGYTPVAAIPRDKMDEAMAFAKKMRMNPRTVTTSNVVSGFSARPDFHPFVPAPEKSSGHLRIAALAAMLVAPFLYATSDLNKPGEQAAGLNAFIATLEQGANTVAEAPFAVPAPEFGPSTMRMAPTFSDQAGVAPDRFVRSDQDGSAPANANGVFDAQIGIVEYSLAHDSVDPASGVEISVTFAPDVGGILPTQLPQIVPDAAHTKAEQLEYAQNILEMSLSFEDLVAPVAQDFVFAPVLTDSNFPSDVQVRRPAIREVIKTIQPGNALRPMPRVERSPSTFVHTSRMASDLSLDDVVTVLNSKPLEYQPLPQSTLRATVTQSDRIHMSQGWEIKRGRAEKLAGLRENDFRAREQRPSRRTLMLLDDQDISSPRVQYLQPQLGSDRDDAAFTEEVGFDPPNRLSQLPNVKSPTRMAAFGISDTRPSRRILVNAYSFDAAAAQNGFSSQASSNAPLKTVEELTRSILEPENVPRPSRRSESEITALIAERDSQETVIARPNESITPNNEPEPDLQVSSLTSPESALGPDTLPHIGSAADKNFSETTPARLDDPSKPSLLRERELAALSLRPPPSRPKKLAVHVEPEPDNNGAENTSKVAIAQEAIPLRRPASIRSKAQKILEQRASVTAKVANKQKPKETTSQARLRIPTSARVASTATIKDGINLGDISLIGIFGTSKTRRALVRLPQGRYVQVTRGDNVSGWTVSAVSEDAVRIQKRGRNHVLRLPN